MEIIAKSRIEALSLGLTKYKSGKPCKYGNYEFRTIHYDCLCAPCIAEKKEMQRKSAEKIRKEKPEHVTNLEAKRYARNRDKRLKLALKYQFDNKEKTCAIQIKRRNAKKERTPMWFGEFDEFVLSEAIELAKIRQETTGIKWHVDHMIPLQGKKVSGLHVAHNLQVIPAFLNQKKQCKAEMSKRNEWISYL